MKKNTSIGFFSPSRNSVQYHLGLPQKLIFLALNFKELGCGADAEHNTQAGGWISRECLCLILYPESAESDILPEICHWSHVRSSL